MKNVKETDKARVSQEVLAKLVADIETLKERGKSAAVPDEVKELVGELGKLIADVKGLRDEEDSEISSDEIKEFVEEVMEENGIDGDDPISDLIEALEGESNG